MTPKKNKPDKEAKTDSLIVRIKKDNIKKEVTFIAEIREYLVCQNGEYRLVPAICRHEGAFLPASTIKGCVKCPKHGWELNVITGKYENPYNLSQNDSQYELTEDGEYVVISKKSRSSITPKEKNTYEYSEDIFGNEDLLEILYVNHACSVIKSKKTSLTTDPWILGSAFSTGWFLKKETPSTHIEAILSSKYCYISHSHPDHLNPSSLIYLKRMGWDPIFIIPKFKKNDLTKQILESIGYKRFLQLRNREWLNLTDHPQIQVEMRFDQSGRNDSGLVIRYGATTLVNMVDAPNLDMDDIGKIDIAMVPFANGASGYPVCWEELMGEKEVRRKKRASNKTTLKKIKEFSNVYKPRCIVPFAGYFHSPLPEDRRIENLNTKNSPDDVIREVGEQFIVINPESASNDTRIGNMIIKKSSQWTVSSQGRTIDQQYAENTRKILHERYDDFEKSELIDFLGSQKYRDDLVVEFQAYDIEFSKMHFNLLWDFSINEETEKYNQHVSGKSRYLRIKVRRYSLSYTIKNNLPWEEFSIGFQSRFTRSPDVYNFSFWDYFQNSLVTDGRIYKDFLQLCDEKGDGWSFFN